MAEEMKRQTVEIEGLNKFIRAMKKAHETELLSILKEVNTEAAAKVEATARPLTPVGEGGLLASLRSSATERQAVVRAGKKKVPYAGVIHFGWPARNIKPQPFLYQALDRRRSEVFEAYQKGLDRIVAAIGAETD